jgi:hypothetical protein
MKSMTRTVRLFWCTVSALVFIRVLRKAPLLKTCRQSVEKNEVDGRLWGRNEQKAQFHGETQARYVSVDDFVIRTMITLERLVYRVLTSSASYQRSIGASDCSITSQNPQTRVDGIPRAMDGSEDDSSTAEIWRI